MYNSYNSYYVIRNNSVALIEKTSKTEPLSISVEKINKESKNKNFHIKGPFNTMESAKLYAYTNQLKILTYNQIINYEDKEENYYVIDVRNSNFSIIKKDSQPSRITNYVKQLNSLSAERIFYIVDCYKTQAEANQYINLKGNILISSKITDLEKRFSLIPYTGSFCVIKNPRYKISIIKSYQTNQEICDFLTKINNNLPPESRFAINNEDYFDNNSLATRSAIADGFNIISSKPARINRLMIDITNKEKCLKHHIEENSVPDTLCYLPLEELRKIFCNRHKAIVFVDGSYKGDVKAAGYGQVIICNGEIIRSAYFVSFINGEYSSVSAELYSTQLALNYCFCMGCKEVVLCYDCTAIVDSLKSRKNDNAISRNDIILNGYLDFFSQIEKKMKVIFTKVKAHSGIEGNVEADRLACCLDG